MLFLVASLLFARGTFREALLVMTLGLLLRWFGSRDDWNVPRMVGWSVLPALVLWVWVAVPEFHLMQLVGSPLLWMALTILAMCQLPRMLCFKLSWLDFMGPALVLFVIIHGGADLLYSGPPNTSYAFAGLFSNIHYMAEYALVVAPLLAFKIVSSPTRARFFYALVLLGDFTLLLLTKSRPGYLAAIASVLIVMPWVGPVIRYRIMGGLLFMIAILYFGNLGHFADRVNDLAFNVRHEERFEIWAELFEMLKGSTWLQWIWGHGVGQFPLDFAERAAKHAMPVFLSPHNFLFEILYSHGLFGVVIVAAWLIQPYRGLWILDAANRTGRPWFLTLALMASMTALWVHAFFTIPFFSRDFLLPYGLLSGALLIVLDQQPRTLSSAR
jgi:O-Antigen ligase